MEIAALTQSDSQTEAITQAEPAACVNLVVTTSSGHSQRCGNPFCNADIEPLNRGHWRRTKRRFCSDHCKSLPRFETGQGDSCPRRYYRILPAVE